MPEFPRYSVPVRLGMRLAFGRVPMNPDVTPTPDWTRLIEAEYREIPGLRLTRAQAQRMWGLSEDDCTSILESLTSANVLTKTPAEVYILAERR